MVNENYWKARSYAFCLNRDLYRDIVHDAFIAFWNSKHKNLFLEHPGTILKTVKNVFMDGLKRKRYQYRGTQGYRSNVEFEDQVLNTITPLDELIGKEYRDHIDSFVASLPDVRSVFIGDPSILKTIVLRRIEGFSNKEIAEELGVSKGLITYYIKKSNLENQRL